MRNRKPYSLPFLSILSLCLLFFIFTQCQSNTYVENRSSLSNNNDSKQKGAHVFGKIDTSNFEFLRRNNIEWVTLVAWSDQETTNSPAVRHHNGDSTLIVNSDSNWLQRIQLLRNAGFKVFVKPHVWIYETNNGKWRSDIFPTNDENWKSWKASYRDFILRYANLAQVANAEMFCIGTEFTRLSLEKPQFWKELIQEVRGLYDGKITYAANWYKEYEGITFWEDLDYIGIQAYFPLVKNEHPTTQQISKGWNQYLPALRAIHKKYNRKILFTEMGYKSTSDAAITPWEWLDYEKFDKTYSPETQANAYEAFFDTVWSKEWFAGMHIWWLRNDYVPKKDSKENLDFMPLGKPAEEVIAKGFE